MPSTDCRIFPLYPPLGFPLCKDRELACTQRKSLLYGKSRTFLTQIRLGDVRPEMSHLLTDRFQRLLPAELVIDL